MRKYFRIIYYLGGVLLFLFIALVGYTQTRTFKSYLRNFILSNSYKFTTGTIQFGNMEGNLLTGFEIANVTLMQSGTIAFSANRVKVKYDPVALLLKRIAINQIEINHPYISIQRSKDGTMNWVQLFNIAQTDSTPSSWTLDIKNISLVKGNISFIDSLRLLWREKGEATIPPTGVIDYAHVELDSVDLITSLYVDQNTYEANIRTCSWISHTPEFRLNNLTGKFFISDKEVTVKDLHVATNHSDVKLEASLQKLNFLKIQNIGDLEKKPVELHLIANDLDTHELKQFLYPWVDFLDHSIRLQADCKGLFGNFEVQKLRVQVDQTDIKIQGDILNLHRPKDLELRLFSTDNSIHPVILQEVLPGLHLPNLDFLGTVSSSFTFNGHPIDFRTTLSATTSAGNVQADGKLTIDQGTLAYSGSIRTTDAALGTILGDEKISSNLAATISLDGIGTDPRTMTGVIKVEMDSSFINGIHIGPSVCVANIADGLLRSRLTVTLGSGNYEISNSLQFLKNDGIKYSIKGRILSLDLGELFRDNYYNSDLSFQLAANGGSTLDVRSDTVRVDFLQSMYGPRKFESGSIEAIFDHSDSAQHRLILKTDPAEMTVNGKFNLTSLIEAFDQSSTLLSQYISYRYENLDSLRSFSSSKHFTEFHPTVSALSSPVECKFHLSLNDLSSLGTFLHTPLLGNTNLDGEMIASNTDFNLNGIFSSDEIDCRIQADTFAISGASGGYYFSGITINSISDKCSSVIDLQANTFLYNTLEFEKPNISISIAADSGSFTLSTLVDSTALVSTEGKFALRNNFLNFVIPQCQVTFDTFAFKNSIDLQCTLGKDGLFFRAVQFEHDATELLVSGLFYPSGVSDASVKINNFLLSSLPYILHRSSYQKSDLELGGIVNATGTFRGSFDHPNITLDLLANGVRARETVLGHIDARISYFEYVLTLFVQFLGKSDTLSSNPDLLISGVVPYDLSLRNEPPHRLNGEINLSLQSKGMNMEFLSPFIPIFENLSGTMICDMKLKGSVDAPRYEGILSIQNASFLFKPLGLRYILDGQFIPDADRIRLHDVTIKNVPEDNHPDGLMHINGDLTLLGLFIKDFHLDANGQLLLIKKDQRVPGQKFYGTLFVATGPDQIHWQGDLTHSLVKGSLLLRDAEITLPPERESAAARVSTIAVTYADDTSKASDKNSDLNKFRNPQISRQTVRTTENNGAEYFLNGIDYDIAVETQGTTTVRFVFNTQTSEELFAALQGRFTFTRSLGTSRFIGQVDVGNRSYYNFFKKFDASGKISFTGDVLNPELNVTARYVGIHMRSATSSTQSSSIQSSDTTYQVAVVLTITGTRNEPLVKTGLEIYDGKEWIKRTIGNEESDALSFLVSGQFSSEITAQQRTSMLGTNLGFGLAAGMITGPLSEALRRNTYGYVQSVDILYYGGQFDKSADVRFIGQLGDATIRYGGRVINDPFGNANVSVEWPVNFLTRNLVLSLERKVEGLEYSDETRRTAFNSAKLFFRINF